MLDNPAPGGVKKGDSPSETVKIIERQSKKPRFQKANLGKFRVQLLGSNSITLKKAPEYKFNSNISNFRK